MRGCHRPWRWPSSVASRKRWIPLNYIDDKNQRRVILRQSNRGEERHSLARGVFHGKPGELRQQYREGQEDQLNALGLVVNIVVLWNTIYMDAALGQLRREASWCTMKMSRACRPSSMNATSTCWGVTPLQCPRQSPKEGCGPYEIPRSATLNRVLRSIAP